MERKEETMTEQEQKPESEKIIFSRDRHRSEVAVAMNHHVVAKDISHIDEMRQHESMKRLLGLASTREGLQALIELKRGEE